MVYAKGEKRKMEIWNSAAICGRIHNAGIRKCWSDKSDLMLRMIIYN